MFLTSSFQPKAQLLTLNDTNVKRRSVISPNIPAYLFNWLGTSLEFTKFKIPCHVPPRRLGTKTEINNHSVAELNGCLRMGHCGPLFGVDPFAGCEVPGHNVIGSTD